MNLLKEGMQGQQDFPVLPQPHGQLGVHGGCDSAGADGGPGGVNAALDEHQEYQQAVSISRRTVGLYRIDADDLKRQRQEQFGGANSEQEEKVLAVREFLSLELKLDQVAIKEMEIERIFTPAKGEQLCLYVTFKYETSVARIFEKTRVMRKESRIIMYVPKQFYERFSSLSTHGYNIRKEEKCQTRIKMGQRDLVLFKRFRGEKWEHVPLPEDLPHVELSSFSRQPAPGRPVQGREGTADQHNEGSSQVGKEVVGQAVSDDVAKKSIDN